MIKFLLAIIFIISSVFAGEVDVLKHKFFANVTPAISKKVKHLENVDKSFNGAIVFLTQPSKMAKVKVMTGDPEADVKDRKSKFVFLPNYPRALEKFEQSVDKYSNPLSAYIAMYIIKTKIPARNTRELIYKRKYAELLYKNTKLCSAYIDYANILSRGTATPPDLQKALKVLNNSGNCIASASDWEKRVIGMKKLRLKRLLGLL